VLPSRLTGWPSSVRVAGPVALALRQAYPGDYVWAGTARRTTALAVRTDQLNISPGARTLNRLLLTWGALSSLFGLKQPAPGFDLAALREALAATHKAAQEVRARQGVLDTLKSSVLAQAEALVEQYYGLLADGAPLRVVLEKDMGGTLAAVSYQYDRQGRAANEELHISLSQFTPDTSANGVNDHVIENDRIIAHEMTHAIMGRAMDFRSLPTWFIEGTAEYIAGAMERVALSLDRLSPRQLIDRVSRPWEGDSPQYAAAYLAVRYLDQATAAGGGLKAIMQRLKSGEHLDQAITAVSGGALAGESGFVAAFLAQGVAFLQSLDTSGRDPGSIKPARAADIVPDWGNPKNQPLRGFRVQWPSPRIRAFPLPAAFGFTPAGPVIAAYRRQR
jgi:hypothetical protein